MVSGPELSGAAIIEIIVIRQSRTRSVTLSKNEKSAQVHRVLTQVARMGGRVAPSLPLSRVVAGSRVSDNHTKMASGSRPKLNPR